MELLQRDLQRDILRGLAELYPRSADLNRSFEDIDNRQLTYNLFYLREHGLIDLKASTLLSGEIQLHNAAITAAGIDFISDDGGLSSILGVVVVKLHEDTLKDLLIRKVEASPADETTKKRLIEKIKSLPADALGTLSMGAMEKGVESIPDIVQWLARWL
ncbi:hypothetical protein [Sinorhizobium meliloti]|uniref:hypothetical protein n=1 Tax=Rhizobium meliloti TaxID=382 RepID=UPI000FDBACCE|nr:hypothetical protein [Sinorhizobium meliloti]RVL61008.1 hypothetical protein CN137_17480 [Sinorhizobium meliloti]